MHMHGAIVRYILRLFDSASSKCSMPVVEICILCFLFNASFLVTSMRLSYFIINVQYYLFFLPPSSEMDRDRSIT
jgi:hypothetical protein